MPNRVDNEELYERMDLGGVKSPKRVRLSGHDREIGWDVKKGSGQQGATMTRTSEDPVPFTVECYCVDQEDFDDWDRFVAAAESTVAGATPKALDCYHPDLARVRINSVVLKKLLGSTPDDMGGETNRIQLIEYRPPKSKGGTPKGSQATKTKREDLDPNAAALAELAALTKKYQDTPWG